MKRTIVTLIMAAAVIAPAAPANAASSPPDHVFPRGLAFAPSKGECYTYRCVWDGRHQGNRHGQSFLLTRWKGGFIAQPITHRRAHRLHVAYCERKNVTCRGYAD